MNSWYTYMFRMEVSESVGPRWWVDLFLLDTVVRDFLSKNRTTINLWRFHRRFNTDEAGHQFSFILYTTREVSETIESFVSGHEAIAVLQQAKLLRARVQRNDGSEIEATCDKSWPLSLQQAWPYYIMGTCQMVLDLMDRLRTSSRPPFNNTSINDYENYYAKLMAEVTSVWQNHGSHAFFHHINAIFGYVPLIAQPRQLAGFLATF